jgi:hypothetical protein
MAGIASPIRRFLLKIIRSHFPILYPWGAFLRRLHALDQGKRRGHGFRSPGNVDGA